MQAPRKRCRFTLSAETHHTRHKTSYSASTTQAGEREMERVVASTEEESARHTTSGQAKGRQILQHSQQESESIKGWIAVLRREIETHSKETTARHSGRRGRAAVVVMVRVQPEQE
jgi:hypothetical protein